MTQHVIVVNLIEVKFRCVSIRMFPEFIFYLHTFSWIARLLVHRQYLIRSLNKNFINYVLEDSDHSNTH